MLGGTIFASTLPSMFNDAGVPDCSLNESPTKQVILMFNESKLQKKSVQHPTNMYNITIRTLTIQTCAVHKYIKIYTDTVNHLKSFRLDVSYKIVFFRHS